MRVYQLIFFGLLIVSKPIFAYQPVIDNKGVDMKSYQKDLTECQNISNQAQDQNKESSLKGLSGGSLGSVLSEIGGSKIAQGVGGMTGGLGGAVSSLLGGSSSGNNGTPSSSGSEQDQILKNCLMGRGYRVLN
jgi:hypothetical protein